MCLLQGFDTVSHKQLPKEPNWNKNKYLAHGVSQESTMIHAKSFQCLPVSQVRFVIPMLDYLWTKMGPRENQLP